MAQFKVDSFIVELSFNENVVKGAYYREGDR